MLLLTIAVLASGLTLEQPGASSGQGVAAGAVTEPARARYRVSRADLGRTYLAFESAAAGIENDRTPDRLIGASKGFDAATGSFFAGDFPSAVRALVEQIVALRGGDAGVRRAASMRMRIVPRTVVLDPSAAGPARVRVLAARMFAPSADEAGADPLRVRIVSAAGVTIGDAALVPAPRSEVVEVPMELSAPTIGAARVVLSSGGQEVESARLAIVTRSLEARRDEVRRTLADLGPAPDDRAALARFICAWRGEQLSDEPGEESSASVVIDFALLGRQVEDEAAIVARNENPYAGAAGDWWLPARASGTPVPMRLYVPKPSAGAGTGPRALIVAVHGAGGDEHLFVDGYAGGRIRALAEKHGFIVAAPRAGLLSASPEVFDAIVETVSMLHDIDPQRVYVMGHSMGGGVVSAWTRQRPKRIAACVSIAGVGSWARATSLPPVLVIAGELDPLVRPGRVESDAQAAAKAGLPVEYRLVAHAGHTLVVGVSLTGAVEWLLGKSGPPVAPPPAGR